MRTKHGPSDKDAVLVCFAVREEAKFFSPARVGKNCWQLITGMGQKNAAESLGRILAEWTPRLVVSAGFAGGLAAGLPLGKVVFDENVDSDMAARLTLAGAARARFFCAERVAVTAAEKSALRQATGAEVVEMESGVIHAICREKQIPAVTVRVISDIADEDLPLDFNRLMTPDFRIDMAKLAGQLLHAPWKIPALIRFQKRTILAARNLAAVLEKSLAGPGA